MALHIIIFCPRLLSLPNLWDSSSCLLKFMVQCRHLSLVVLFLILYLAFIFLLKFNLVPAGDTASPTVSQEMVLSPLPVLLSLDLESLGICSVLHVNFFFFFHCVSIPKKHVIGLQIIYSYSLFCSTAWLISTSPVFSFWLSISISLLFILIQLILNICIDVPSWILNSFLNRSHSHDRPWILHH